MYPWEVTMGNSLLRWAGLGIRKVQTQVKISRYRKPNLKTEVTWLEAAVVNFNQGQQEETRSTYQWYYRAVEG